MNKNIYLLCAIAFLQGLVFYGPVATIFRQHRGISISDIFLLETIFIILMLVFEIPWGFFADRIGYKKTLLASFFLFFISKIIFYFSHSFIGFLGEAITAALAISGMSGCDSALIYSTVEGKNSDKAFSYYSAAGTAGLLMAALASTLILKYSIDLTAFFTIIPYGIAFVITFYLVDADKRDHREKCNTLIDSIKNLWQNKSIFIFVMAMGFINESTHAVCVFLNQPLYERSGIGIIYFGLIKAVMQVICLASAKAYKLSRRVGVKRLYIISVITIISANMFLLYFKNWFMVIAMIALIELAFALCQPLAHTIENDSIITGDRATLLSAYAMAANLIGGLSYILIGLASDVSLEGGIIVCAILEVAALVLIIIFFRGGEHKEKNAESTEDTENAEKD